MLSIISAQNFADVLLLFPTNAWDLQGYTDTHVRMARLSEPCRDVQLTAKGCRANRQRVGKNSLPRNNQTIKTSVPTLLLGQCAPTGSSGFNHHVSSEEACS
jgi:hypothetical protein